MILTAITALAITPKQLEAALPEARAQLATCAREGCTAEEGARAAYLAAIYTYTSEGVAEGGLTATVRLLDPALFETLPPVLRDAATAPTAWALATDLRPDRELRTALEKRPDPSPYEPDDRLPHGSITVGVVDAATGEPVPATVRLRDEYILHRTHHETGRWTSSVRYMPDGSERFFQKGDALRLDVSAPGYSYVKVAVVLAKRKANYIAVQLQRWTPGNDGSPEAERAIAAHRSWVEAEAVALRAPSDENFQRVQEARVKAAGLARDWIDAGGGVDALTSCLHTGTPLFCEGVGSAPISRP